MRKNAPAEPRRLSPWPLVYADLLATGDPRLRTIAQVLRDHEA
ncbi:type IV toxin-antitoxin system AbiEi family antitoxin [Nocardioides sp. YR527]